jgi:hypothetical protein
MVEILTVIIVLIIAKIAGTEAADSKGRIRQAREINDEID